MIFQQFSARIILWLCLDIVADLPSVPSRPSSSKYKVLPGIAHSKSVDASVTSAASNSSSAVRSENPSNNVAMKLNAKEADKSKDNAVRRTSDKVKSGAGDALNAGRKNKCSTEQLAKTVSSSSSNTTATNSGSVVKTLSDRGVKPTSRTIQQQQQPTTHQLKLNTSKTKTTQQICLAVKLPSGKRIQKHFQPTDTLESVLRFAEKEEHCDFKSCEFVRADNRQVLSDLHISVQSAGLQDRTVLFLQLPEIC